MSDKRVSELTELTSPAVTDLLYVIDVSEPVQADRSKYAQLSNIFATDPNRPTSAEKAALAGTGTPSGANKFVTNDDSRLTNNRTPTAHASSHGAAGSDAIDVRNLGGFPGGTTSFLRADATFASPGTGGVGDVVGPSSAVDLNVAVFDGTTGKLIKDGGKTIAQILSSASVDDLAKAALFWQPGTILGGAGTFSINCPMDGNSLSTAGTMSKSVQADNIYADFLSGSSATNPAGWRWVFTLFQRRHDPTFETIIWSPNSLTNVRMWVGITSAQMTDSDTASGHFAGFRFSSVAGDTGWRPVTRDGTTQNVGTNIGTVTADTAYRLKVRCSGTHVFVSVNGGTEQDITSNLPTSTQDLGPDHRLFTQTAAGRSFKFARCSVKFGSTP